MAARKERRDALDAINSNGKSTVNGKQGPVVPEMMAGNLVAGMSELGLRSCQLRQLAQSRAQDTGQVLYGIILYACAPLFCHSLAKQAGCSCAPSHILRYPAQ